VSDLHLPSALAKDADQLATAIIERHGGRVALSVMDFEVIASMVRVFNAMRAAAPTDLPRLVDSLAKLEAMLPSSSSKVERSPLQQLHDHCAGVPS
jgi:hypothetical protein